MERHHARRALSARQKGGGMLWYRTVIVAYQNTSCRCG